MGIVRTVTSHIPVITEYVKVLHIKQYWICRFTVDVAVRPSCIYNSLEEKLNHDYCQTCSYKSRLSGSGGSERTRFLERSLRTLKAAEGNMLVQTTSPLHHCSSGSTNSLPPEVLQLENLPTFGAPCQAPQSESSPIHLLELPTPPPVLGPRQLL